MGKGGGAAPRARLSESPSRGDPPAHLLRATAEGPLRAVLCGGGVGLGSRQPGAVRCGALLCATAQCSAAFLAYQARSGRTSREKRQRARGGRGPCERIQRPPAGDRLAVPLHPLVDPREVRLRRVARLVDAVLDLRGPLGVFEHDLLDVLREELERPRLRVRVAQLGGWVGGTAATGAGHT
eukprot:gene3316-biopygen20201